MSVFWIITAVFVVTGVILTGLVLFPRTALAAGHKARTDKARLVEDPEYWKFVAANAVLSSGLIFGTVYGLHSQLFSGGPLLAIELVWQSAAILLIYDFLYYLMHRFAFHQWAFGKRVHAVHHKIRTPYALDSLFIHPYETLAGTALFMLCVFAVGPVHPWTFGVTFFVYSVWNVFLHSAFHLPFFPFKSMTKMVEHHDVHHASMKGGYFASITPIFDFLFKTAR